MLVETVHIMNIIYKVLTAALLHYCSGLLSSNIYSYCYNTSISFRFIKYLKSWTVYIFDLVVVNLLLFWKTRGGK